MAVIDKISVKNTSYDIGADSDNVVYDSNNSVKDKIDEYEAIIPSSASSSNKLATANDIPSLTNYIEKSQTTGLVKNDGTIDTNTYAQTSDLPGTATSSALGLVKPDGTTITVDANGTISSSGGDLSNYIQKSATEGLVMNDGSIDTSKHVHLQPTGSGLSGKLQTKTWTGLTSFYGANIWTDGTNIYYSYSSGSNYQYVLDKSTSTWNTKTWNGYNYINGYQIWTDGDNIYYSDGSNQYVLDKSTSTWNTKSWTGLTSFSGANIWTDGENIYYSAGNSAQYVLDKSTSTWSAKTWNGYTQIDGQEVWTDGENIYFSYNFTGAQYVLDKSTSTWSAKTWNGYNSLRGNNIWTDGENIYFSNSSNQYILDKSTSTWSTKTWTGLTSFYGNGVWTDGTNIYLSNGSDQYVFVSEEIYADGFVKSDGTIDTNEYAKTSEVSTIKKTRYTITATN